MCICAEFTRIHQMVRLQNFVVNPKTATTTTATMNRWPKPQHGYVKTATFNVYFVKIDQLLTKLCTPVVVVVAGRFGPTKTRRFGLPAESVRLFSWVHAAPYLFVWGRIDHKNETVRHGYWTFALIMSAVKWYGRRTCIQQYEYFRDNWSSQT